MGAISDFLAAFRRDFDRYLTIEREVRALCEEALRGIKFLWHSRVKAVESLEKKLRERIEEYKNEKDNVADIKDLIGGRIILARSEDIQRVENIISKKFRLIRRVQHPKSAENWVGPAARFRGYGGSHLHVKRPGPSDQHSCDLVIEIQVMTGFMWTFMELEHDVIYKQSHGEPTKDLTLVLEALKGIANLGEISLEMYDRQFVTSARLLPHMGNNDPRFLAGIRDVIDEVRLDERDMQCLQDLRLTDPRQDKARIEESKGRLLEGSCSWVLEDPAFVDWWSQGDSRFLWIHGDPGKGKTMMMIALISEVSKRLNGRPGLNILAYFFCQNTSDNLNTTVSVLRGLVYHLVDQEKKLVRHIRKSYDSAGKRLFEDENALYTLRAMLMDILIDPSLGSVYFMVDALDECDSRIHDLLDWIIHMDSEISPKIKWLTTSRNLPAFIERLGRGHQLHTCLELNSEHIARAVESFVDYKVKGLADLKGYSRELELSVRKSLLGKAEDTFLWVALVCKELKEVRAERVASWLGRTPAGLVPLYKRMLDQVLQQKDEDDVEACRRILRAVTLAFRPLRLEEIAVFADVSENVSDLAGHCGSFIIIREKTAYLVHQSAKDFLSDEERRDIFDSGKEHGHANAAHFCLTLLLSTLKRDICGTKAPGVCPRDVDESIIEAHIPCYAQYACLYWVDHLQQAGSCAPETFPLSGYRIVYQFFQRHFLHWLEALSLMSKMTEAVLAINSLCSTPRLRKNAHLFSFVKDARRFILDFRHIIETAPLQVYNSALVFSPKSSIIGNSFSNSMPAWIEELPIVEEACTALLQTLENHSSDFNEIAVSPDGQLLASASSDNTVRLWDPVTGAVRGTLKGHASSITAVSFLPNGRLASASHDGAIRVWDPMTGISQYTLDHKKMVVEIVSSPNGRLIASISQDGIIKTWDITRGTLQSTINADPEGMLDLALAFSQITFCHDGGIIATTGGDETIRLWDPLGGGPLGRLDGHLEWISALVSSPDGSLLASGSVDDTIRLWDPVNKACRGTLKDHLGEVGALAFSPNGQLLASGSDDTTVKIWNPSGILQYRLSGHSRPVTIVKFSLDGQLLASASYDYTIRLWNSFSGTSQGILQGHLDPISGIAFFPNNQLLASASWDSTVRLWDLTVKASRGTLQGHRGKINALAFSFDGSLLASACWDCTVKLWTSVGEFKNTLEAHSATAGAIAFSPTSCSLASVASDGCTIRLWDLVENTNKRLEGNTYDVDAVAFSPNGEVLASASGDGTVRIWDSTTGESRGALDGHGYSSITTIALSPNGRILVAGNAQTIRLWDLATKTSQGTLEGHSSQINAMAFSPDAQRLASTHDNGKIRLWELKTRNLIQQIVHRDGHYFSVEHDYFKLYPDYFDLNYGKHLSFSHDGSQLEIDGRRLQVSSFLHESSYEHDVADLSYALDYRMEWVMFKGRRVLWLPPDYRPQVYAFHKNTLALGRSFGAITVLRFSETITPF